MKNIGIKILMATFLMLGLLTCKKDPEVNIEEFEIASEELTVGSTSANIVGRYDYSGKVVNMKVLVADNEYMNHAKTFEAELNNKAFAVEITDLKMATMYWYYYSVFRLKVGLSLKYPPFKVFRAARVTSCLSRPPHKPKLSVSWII